MHDDFRLPMVNMFVKEFSALVSLVIVTSGTDCPDGWLAFEGSCYLFAQTPAHFTEAQHYCEQRHGNLIHVDSALENDFIRSWARELRRSDGHFWWLGLTDELVEGHWRWLDTNTPATFVGWAPDEPDFAEQDCAAFGTVKDFQWIDVFCNENNVIPLCEMRIEQPSVVG